MIEILGELLTLLGVIVAVIGVLTLSYVVSKRIGQGMMGSYGPSGMKVVSRLVVGQDKSIVIINIGAKFYLIGISNDNINLLREIPPEDIKDIPSEGNKISEGLPQFKDFFSDILRKKH